MTAPEPAKVQENGDTAGDGDAPAPQQVNAGNAVVGADRTLTYTGDQSLKHNVSLDFNRHPGRVLVHDQAGVVAVGNGCAPDAPPGSPNDAVCNLPAKALVLLGASEDTFTSNQPSTGAPVPVEVHGGAGQDDITGTGGSGSQTVYSFYGEAGADTLQGGSGADALDGGADNDVLRGGGGNDVEHGGAGRDFLYGDDGDDELRGEAGNDLLFGDNGNDKLYAGDDTNPGDIQLLYGGAGDDYLEGSLYADNLFGEEGNDTLVGRLGGDEMDGGAGVDRVSYGEQLPAGVQRSQGVTADLQTQGTRSWGGPEDVTRFPDGTVWQDIARNVEQIVGSPLADALLGDDGANDIQGGGGNDTIDGRGGNDTLSGGAGNDTLTGGSGADTLTGDEGDDRFALIDWTVDHASGGPGTDTAMADIDPYTGIYDILDGIENIIGPFRAFLPLTTSGSGSQASDSAQAPGRPS